MTQRASPAFSIFPCGYSLPIIIHVISFLYKHNSGQKHSLQSFKLTNLVSSQLYWKEKKKNLSCFRNIGFFGSWELEMARRISVGFLASRSELTLPISSCSHIQHLPASCLHHSPFMSRHPGGPHPFFLCSQSSFPEPASGNLTHPCFSLPWSHCGLPSLSTSYSNFLLFPSLLHLHSFNPESWSASHM